jgi:hypothetical protein
LVSFPKRELQAEIIASVGRASQTIAAVPSALRDMWVGREAQEICLSALRLFEFCAGSAKQFPVIKRPQTSFTLILFGVTLVVLLLSVPTSVREAVRRGNFYVFTAEFSTDVPKRLAGPGRFRFIVQPVVATSLGIRDGVADARMGHAAYLFGLLFHRKSRPELLKSGFRSILNLVLMGILLDSICQWLILGASYPGAALLVGPILVAAPYSIARAVTNRCAHLRSGR